MYNPAMQIPYTTDELLFMVEPTDRESKEAEAILGSSIDGGEETINNALISVQGTQDVVSMIEGRAHVNLRNLVTTTNESSGDPTTQMEDIKLIESRSRTTS